MIRAIVQFFIFELLTITVIIKLNKNIWPITFLQVLVISRKIFNEFRCSIFTKTFSIIYL
jgi:hypothetical protein